MLHIEPSRFLCKLRWPSTLKSISTQKLYRLSLKWAELEIEMEVTTKPAGKTEILGKQKRKVGGRQQILSRAGELWWRINWSSLLVGVSSFDYSEENVRWFRTRPATSVIWSGSHISDQTHPLKEFHWAWIKRLQIHKMLYLLKWKCWWQKSNRT